MPDRHQDGSVMVHEPGRRTDPGKVGAVLEAKG